MTCGFTVNSCHSLQVWAYHLTGDMVYHLLKVTTTVILFVLHTHMILTFWSHKADCDDTHHEQMSISKWNEALSSLQCNMSRSLPLSSCGYRLKNYYHSLPDLPTC